MTSVQFGRLVCPVCHEIGILTTDNTVIVRFRGPDQRGMLDYIAYYCADREECPGYLPIFLRQLQKQQIERISGIIEEEIYAEPRVDVVNYFERLYGFRPHVGNGVPVVKELSLHSLIVEAKFAADLSNDDAIASWTV